MTARNSCWMAMNSFVAAGDDIREYMHNEKGLGGPTSVEETSCTLALTNLLEMSSDTLLHDLKSVFGVSEVQLREVGDSSDCGQDAVISDMG
jgi:hypothetical protein